ncbi:hypothetical protein BU16DRAFT_327351 [Lophium mytilinum]|uniref:Uncharacterized protein n=1 Tax=Lophium mytilinum TaxID=390894 RepID=A0A6A6QZF8_9PEZI|nr:hypothetical protein BU16DRAFT_327351 [Lophium mytilinum]
MTSLFPHPAYAEEQPHARTILYLHVIRAGTQAAALVATVTATASSLYYRPRSLAAFVPRLIIHSARAVPIGIVFSGLATAGRMYGREQIEWQDRTWRLLENKPQERADWWAIGGGVGGAVAGVWGVRRGVLPGVVRGRYLGRTAKLVLGGAGVGMGPVGVGLGQVYTGLKG